MFSRATGFSALSYGHIEIKIYVIHPKRFKIQKAAKR